MAGATLIGMTTEDVRLRDVVEDDLEAFCDYEQDPEAARRSRFTPRPRDAFMAHWKQRVLGDDANFVQTVTVDGEVAGSFVAWWEEDRRFLGYWLGRAYWGRGIGTRALELFLEREKNRPLHADPFIGNTGSVRLLEKHGFRPAGTVQYGENEHVLLVLA
ncbi:hypothetical protein STAFG_7739 [Streptomyces afghaniensis 772]|uniref:N-acetyltransferase domain-containing protein n=2 Tax=Streptomyces TaxID=1883 RepID=S4MP07_9ACTN|nr:hypothetical protein STAFG_7739 [Streptomyces afghaniensis 772]